MQAIVDSIPDLLVSQNKTKTVELFFCLRKISIDTEFALFLVGQGVYIKGRRISEQGSMHCRLIYQCSILYWTICSSPNFEGFQQCGNSWLIQKKL